MNTALIIAIDIKTHHVIPVYFIIIASTQHLLKPIVLEKWLKEHRLSQTDSILLMNLASMDILAIVLVVVLLIATMIVIFAHVDIRRIQKPEAKK